MVRLFLAAGALCFLATQLPAQTCNYSNAICLRGQTVHSGNTKDGEGGVTVTATGTVPSGGGIDIPVQTDKNGYYLFILPAQNGPSAEHYDLAASPYDKNGEEVDWHNCNNTSCIDQWNYYNTPPSNYDYTSVFYGWYFNGNIWP